MAHDVCKVRMETLTLQRGPSGRRTLFVAIKYKVASQDNLILKRNSQFEVNKRLSAATWATL